MLSIQNQAGAVDMGRGADEGCVGGEVVLQRRHAFRAAVHLRVRRHDRPHLRAIRLDHLLEGDVEEGRGHRPRALVARLQEGVVVVGAQLVVHPLHHLRLRE